MPHFFFHDIPVVQKRLPQNIDLGEFKITRYDVDNLYPQRIEQLALRSPLTKSAISVLSDFINGDGWQNNGDVVLNRFGWTADDLLFFLSKDLATFGGFALHFNYDGNGRIMEVQLIPFEYVRYGLPDKNGRHAVVKVSNNWEKDPWKLKEGAFIKPVTFSIFNLAKAQAETLTGGRGQVLYFTGDPDTYPLATFDAVANATQTDAEIQLYELNNTAKGFHGTTILKYPGALEDTEKDEIQEIVNQMTGSNAPGMVLAQIEEDYTGDLLETIPPNNNDRLFEFTSNHVRDTIVQNYQIPPPLMGIFPQTGVFNQTAMKEAYLYYNIRTKNKRNVVSRIFEVISNLWGPEVTGGFGEIKAQTFESEVQQVVASNPPEIPMRPIDEEPDIEIESTPEGKLIRLYGT